MIASWRGLAIAIGVAIALVIAVIVRGGEPSMIDHAIAPGFVADAVTGLRWRGGSGDVEVRRRVGGWQIAGERPVPADADAVRDVFAALRGGRWQRAGVSIASHRSLVIEGATPHVIGLGDPLPGDAQAWITVDGRGLLVDAWIARALDPAPLALHVRSPIDQLEAATDVVITHAELTRHLRPQLPPQLVQPSGGHFAIQALGVAKLARAFANVTLVRLPDNASAPAHGLTITITADPVHTGTLTLGGPCAGAAWLVAVAGTWGDGCVDEEAAKAVVIAIEALRWPERALVDRDPISADPRRVTLLDGTRLDFTTGKVDDAPGDAKAMNDLKAALQYGGPAVAEPRPTTPPSGKLVVEVAAGPPITLWLYPARLFARDDEPFAVPITNALWDLAHAGGRAFRNRTPWLEEPTTVTALQIDAVRFVRGDVIGAWTRVPGGPVTTVDAERLEALAKGLAQPSVLGDAAGPIATVHTITITVTPPVGAPIRHRVAIGPPVQIYCPAEAGPARILLSRDVCARVTALMR